MFAVLRPRAQGVWRAGSPRPSPCRRDPDQALPAGLVAYGPENAVARQRLGLFSTRSCHPYLLGCRTTARGNWNDDTDAGHCCGSEAEAGNDAEAESEHKKQAKANAVPARCPRWRPAGRRSVQRLSSGRENSRVTMATWQPEARDGPEGPGCRAHRLRSTCAQTSRAASAAARYLLLHLSFVEWQAMKPARPAPLPGSGYTGGLLLAPGKTEVFVFDVVPRPVGPPPRRLEDRARCPPPASVC